MTINILDKNLFGFTGTAWLVEIDGYYFIVSGTIAFTGWECLVFPANKNGEVTSWGDVAGGRGFSHEDALADLVEKIKKFGIEDTYKNKYYE